AFCVFFTTARPPEIHTLSLHDALPICYVALWRHADAGDPLPGREADYARPLSAKGRAQAASVGRWLASRLAPPLRVLSSPAPRRSEEHTSELQSRENLVCRPRLEKKRY